MTVKEKQEVIDAMPLDCKVNVNGKVYPGRVAGNKLDFPVVTFGDFGSFEVSWQLCKRIMTGECREIIY